MAQTMLSLLRRFGLALSIVLMMLAFQNCGKQSQSCSGLPGVSVCNPESANQNSNNSKRAPATNTVSIGNGGSSNGNKGGTPSGASNSGSGAATVSPPGSQSGAITGVNSDAFKITKHPTSVVVKENQEIRLEVEVSGGKYPYQYHWFKDEVAVSQKFGGYSMIVETADRYDKEGLYYVKVTDASGATLTSGQARVSIADVEEGCKSGAFYISSKSRPSTQLLDSLFYNSRGKFFLDADNDNLKYFSLDSQDLTNLYYLGFERLNGFPNAKFKEKHSFQCRFAIPKIHDPTVNPGYIYQWSRSEQAYMDGCGYKYEGSTVFECRNNKWVHISTNCRWTGNRDGSCNPGSAPGGAR